MKTKTPNLSFFAATGEDLPLFSGTCQTVKDPLPNTAEVSRQPSLFSQAAELARPVCPICLGTGKVKPHRNKPARRCICSAGQ
jgi:hypothetical protein